jgi:hypothetical protein
MHQKVIKHFSLYLTILFVDSTDVHDRICSFSFELPDRRTSAAIAGKVLYEIADNGRSRLAVSD